MSARHAYREAARLLATLLPCEPMSHATMRHRTHRVAADLEHFVVAETTSEPDVDPVPEMVVLIDGAPIRAAYGYQSRHVDVTVGKIEGGQAATAVALAPRGAEAPLATMR
jgi:hypothetical protein